MNAAPLNDGRNAERGEGPPAGQRFDDVRTCEVLVVGAGVAGLAAALGCAPRRVTLLTKTPLGAGGSTAWAQGGVAVALGPDDTPALHAADTVAVAAGLADPAAVDVLTNEGPGRIAQLIALGARFDRDPATGGLALGREAAHARRRILHAGGDATGAELSRALAAAVRRAAHVEVEEGSFALDLAIDPRGGRRRVVGVVALAADGRRVLHLAGAVVLATGGAGGLYRHTTNPPEVTADGLAMAARAGARLVDLELVQFHPTALAPGEPGAAAPVAADASTRAVGGDEREEAGPLPLLTEALRGEGALLIDGDGVRFMVDEHPLAELAPRDVVARAIHRRLAEGGQVFLDARQAVGWRFPERFPTVFRAARAAGLDPRVAPLPVVPAAHYHMGGVETDADGRTSLAGLWACGETASTGAHGANRLASNSLLEGLVFGARVAEQLRCGTAALPGADAASLARLEIAGAGGAVRRATAAAGGPVRTASAVRRRLRDLMWERVGLVRDGAGLVAAQAELARLAAELAAPAADAGPAALRHHAETRNLLLAARLVTAAALGRPESRGAHYRADHPATDPAWAWRQRWVLAGDEPSRVDETSCPARRAEAGSGR